MWWTRDQRMEQATEFAIVNTYQSHCDCVVWWQAKATAFSWLGYILAGCDQGSLLNWSDVLVQTVCFGMSCLLTACQSDCRKSLTKRIMFENVTVEIIPFSVELIAFSILGYILLVAFSWLGYILAWLALIKADFWAAAIHLCKQYAFWNDVFADGLPILFYIGNRWQKELCSKMSRSRLSRFFSVSHLAFLATFWLAFIKRYFFSRKDTLVQTVCI